MESLEVVNRFGTHLKRIGYASKSTAILPRRVYEFLSYSKPASLASINQNDILAYYSYLKIRAKKRGAGKLSQRYIGHHLYALRTFFNWLELSKNLAANPMSGLEFRIYILSRRPVLSLSEMHTLYSACLNHLERAMLSLFYGCGLRKSEGLQIELKDVQFQAGLLYIRNGKAGKHRIVPLCKRVKQDLLTYILKERKACRGVKSFLTNACGERLSANKLSKNFQMILTRTSLQRPASLHTLRHSIATHLLIAGMRMEDVRDFLGHSKLETTQIYTHINDDQLLRI